MRRAAAGTFVAVAMVALAWTSPARGYMVSKPLYPCVETLVGYVDSVVLGKVVRVGPVRANHSTAVDIEVNEVLKGPERRRVIQLQIRDVRAWEQCRERGGDLVLFQCKTGQEEPRRLFTWGDQGGAVVVNERLMFYDLTRRHDQRFDVRMRRLEDPKEVLATVRGAAEFERKTPPPPRPVDHWNWVSLPILREGQTLKDMPGMPQLLLPLDERTEAAAEEWEKSAEPPWRIIAVRAAARLDTKGSRAVIERLLRDPAYVVENMQGWDSRIDWRRRRVYFVRQAAWEARTYGTPRTGVVLEGPDVGFYAPPARRAWIWLGTGVVVILGAAVVAGRRWRSWGLGVAVVFLGLSLATSWAWWRSWRVMDAVSFVTGRSEHEVVSQHGRVSWLRVHDGPTPRGTMVRSARVGGRDGVWFSPHLSADVLRERLGVSASSGRTASPGAGVAAYPFHLLQVRYSLLLGALAAWPVAFAVVRAVGVLRRRLWAAMGRCRRCGYDVRWGKGACPECGAELPFVTNEP